MGIRIDYLAPTLYLSDIVLVGLLMINLKFKFKNGWKWLILGLVMGLNLLVAQNKMEAEYKILRLMELLGLFFYVKNNQQLANKFLKIIIPGWIVLESFLGWSQIIKGSSLNGIMYFLGERAINTTTIGVAKWSIFGSEYLRAYGTFSHPNSLAGFLLVSVLLWCGMKNKAGFKSLFWWIVFWAGILGIIICGSRNVWLVGLVILMGIIYKINKLWLIVGPLIFGIIAYKFRFFSGWDPESLKKRWELIIVAIKMIKESLFLGVGAGNFLVRLPEYGVRSPILWLQPVHNIYLFILSELGLLGVLVLGWITEIYKLKIKKITVELLPVMAIILTGMSDHYWVTLIQNMWLIVLVFGLMVKSTVK